MRIIARRTLRQFWEAHQRNRAAKTPLEDWYAQISAADWATPAEVKAQFGDASILQGGRVIFNIGGNKYRLVVRINYPYRVVYIRFVGTHAEYDEIDAGTI
ncbi:MAG TPA: type II toxin-antitoxin system HigB family toxin [Gemmatimonadaceae bacterium]|nr:type II toxin-antitoxin system HigB family toxin [Gemmatimonadaceae bacterium]